MTTPWRIVLLLAACSLARASETSTSGTFPLKPVPLNASERLPYSANRMLRLDANGEAEMPFATASGKVRFKVEDDQTRLINRTGREKLRSVGSRDGRDQATGSVTVTLGGKPFQYPLRVSYYRANSIPLLQVEGLVYLEADIGGTTIRLYDSNLNGCFGDVAESGGRQVKDQMQIGAAGASRSLCQYILLGETLHEIELVSGGEALRVQPYTGPVATLTPAFPAGWQAHLALTHVESGFEASASAGKKTMLPPGAYLLRARDCQSGDAADVRKREVRLFSRFALSRASKFFVTPGENTVAFGPPFKLGFDAVRSTEYEDLVTVRDVWLIGAAGECYDAYNAGENAENTHTCFVRAGGREQQIGTMRYG